jgi:hypothetical protein
MMHGVLTKKSCIPGLPDKKERREESADKQRSSVPKTYGFPKNDREDGGNLMIIKERPSVKD